MATVRDPRLAHVRKDGRVTLHEQLIRDLVASDPRICRNGFARACKDLFERIGQDPDDIPIRDFRPDAYMIDEEAEEVVIFEVEVHCHLSEKKLYDYGVFWFDWESEGGHEWMPRLVTVDRYGNRNTLDMRQLFYKSLEVA